MAKTEKSLTRLDPLADSATLLSALGMTPEDGDGFDQVSTGGITKWVDLAQFQSDPSTNKPVLATGLAFAGVLLSRQEIEVAEEEPGEDTERGTRVRYFYSLKLLSPCPVSYKNEDKIDIKEQAKIGDIVSIGERHALKGWRDQCEGGGSYAVVVRPHSRIRIGGGRTMWTFDLWTKTLRPPMKIRAELVKAAF